MTLCVSWIRKSEDNNDELIFATDSCLSGGIRWKHGVKLFELSRKDCLICFAGETDRTYPLILNLISSIKFDKHLSNTHTDIGEVLDYLSNLFTNLCNNISDYGNQTFHSALGDFEFLFGGWSWIDSQFKLWILNYNFEAKSFVHDSVGEEGMFYAFIGDELEKAQTALEEEMANNRKILSKEFDYEPLKVLLYMIRDTSYSTIDGAIQIAKIHPPGITEFFGVMWPSIDGSKTFLGKDVNFENNPDVEFIDPDTGSVIGDELPKFLSSIDVSVFGLNTKFVLECYPKNKKDIYELKSDLTKRERQILKSILSEIAYSRFIVQEQNEMTEEF